MFVGVDLGLLGQAREPSSSNAGLGSGWVLDRSSGAIPPMTLPRRSMTPYQHTEEALCVVLRCVWPR
jgi:hypothetical protein